MTSSFVSLVSQVEGAYNDNEVVRIKGVTLPITLALLATMLGRSPTSAVSDPGTSLADGNIPDNGTTTTQTEASNSSASAAITITMI
jgi:hypothetical protein